MGKVQSEVAVLHERTTRTLVLAWIATTEIGRKSLLG